MNYTPLTAISSIDGRYHSKTKALQAYYSEYGLIRYRVLVEVEYFIALTTIPLPSLKDFPANLTETLRDLYRNFSEDDALWIKETEKVDTLNLIAEILDLWQSTIDRKNIKYVTSRFKKLKIKGLV